MNAVHLMELKPTVCDFTLSMCVSNDRISKIWDNLVKTLSNIYQTTYNFAQKFKHYTVFISNLCYCILNGIKATLHFLHKLFETPEMISSNTKSQPSLLWRMIQWAKITIVVAIPFALFTVCNEIKNTIQGHDRTASLLRMAEGLSWGGESFASFLSSMHELNILSTGALKWVFSFYLTSSFLALASLFLNARKLHQTKELSAQLNKNDLSALKDHYIKVNDRLDIDSEKVQSTFRLAFQNLRKEKEADFVNLIKKRIQNRKTGYGIAIASSVILWVGMMIFLFTSYGAIASGILAIAYALSVIKFILNKRSDNQFCIALDKLK